jgi:hypothetical protein
MDIGEYLPLANFDVFLEALKKATRYPHIWLAWD